VVEAAAAAVYPSCRRVTVVPGAPDVQLRAPDSRLQLPPVRFGRRRRKSRDVTLWGAAGLIWDDSPLHPPPPPARLLLLPSLVCLSPAAACHHVAGSVMFTRAVE